MRQIKISIVPANVETASSNKRPLSDIAILKVNRKYATPSINQWEGGFINQFLTNLRKRSVQRYLDEVEMLKQKFECVFHALENSKKSDLDYSSNNSPRARIFCDRHSRTPKLVSFISKCSETSSQPKK